MGDTVTCERCGKPGRRRIGYVAPEGWYFGSFTFDAGGDHDPGDFLIVHACSAECSDALWTKQDGHKWSAIEQRVNVPDELRRAARLQAIRIREQATAIETGCYPTGEQNNEAAGRIFARLLNASAKELLDAVESEIDALNQEGARG